MQQKVSFTVEMYTDQDGFDWRSATEAAREALRYGDQMQEYSLHLVRVTEISLVENED